MFIIHQTCCDLRRFPRNKNQRSASAGLVMEWV